MCHFLSFLVHAKTGKLYFGKLNSHSGIAGGWGLKPGEYREAEWTKDDSGESLTVRVEDGEEETFFKAMVLGDYKSRKSLLKSISFGKTSERKLWYKEGQLHREDGPAIEYTDGSKYWYKEGNLHREDGPAVEWANETKFWYKEGKLHREDGPAVEWANGNKEWWLEGKRYTEEVFKKIISARKKKTSSRKEKE